GANNNIALVTLNRQNALNSLNSEMLDQLENTFLSLQQDNNIRVVIIYAEGKSWCAGADLKWMYSLGMEAKDLIAKGQKVFELVENHPCPVIAAINGFALGGGMELALSCDIRIASKNAIFGQPEVTIGLPPGWGGTYRLQKLLGVSIAKDLILTGRKITAEEAYRLNFVSEVCNPEELKEKAIKWAEIIASNAPIAVREAKRAIHRNYGLSLSEAYSNEIESADICFHTEDIKEGIKALFEKRKPNFKGK
ncbi:MAG: enoyl-CoA hydratase/isomerase family protein, partial [Candidatus Heimdallarchaeaceae archaeon]